MKMGINIIIGFPLLETIINDLVSCIKKLSHFSIPTIDFLQLQVFHEFFSILAVVKIYGIGKSTEGSFIGILSLFLQ